MPFAKEFHFYRVGADESVKAQTNTTVYSDGRERTLTETPTIAETDEAYQKSFRSYSGMHINQLGDYVDDLGHVMGSTHYNAYSENQPAEGDEQEEIDPEGVNRPDSLSHIDSFDERAFSRAYAQKILKETNVVQRGAKKRRWFSKKEAAPRSVTEKERMFLVRDFIDNAAESALASNLLKEHGFKNWSDLINRTGVSPDFVQNLTKGDNGRSAINFMDITQKEMEEQSWWERHGSKVTKGVAAVIGTGISVGVGVATGGAVPLAVALAGSAGGIGGSQLVRFIAKKFSHDFKMREQDEHGKTKGEHVVEQLTREFMAQHDAAKAYFAENTKTVPDDGMQLDKLRNAFVGGEKGKDLLGMITKGFRESAVNNLHNGESSVKEYWDIARRSNKIQFWSGLAGGLIGGGLAGFGMGKVEAAAHLHDQLAKLHAGGLNLDLDGDGIDHLVKVYTDGQGNESAHWMLQLADAGRINGSDHITTLATSHADVAQNVLGSTEHVISQSNIQDLLLADQTSYLAKEALNMDSITQFLTSQSDRAFASVMQTAILSGTLAGGGAYAAAEALDAVNSRITGNTSKKYQEQAKRAEAILGAQTAEEGKAGRQKELDDQILNGQPAPETAAELPTVPEETPAVVSDPQAERLALIQKISDFEKAHGKSDLNKGKRDFESIDRAILSWNNFHSPEGKVLFVDVERVGLSWDDFKTKVAELLHNNMTASNRLSLILAVDGGEMGMLEVASRDPRFNPADRDFKAQVAADLDVAIQAVPAGHIRGFATGIDRLSIINRGYAPTSPSPDLPSWKEYLLDIGKRDGIADVGSKVDIHPDTIRS